MALPLEHPTIKKAFENPHNTMKGIARQLEPENAKQLEHKTLVNYVEMAKLLLKHKRAALGDAVGEYERIVSAAEAHLDDRKELGERMAGDMLATLRSGSLTPEQIADIGSALPELESHCGQLGGRVAELRAALEQPTKQPERIVREPAPQGDRVSAHVDSLVDSLSRPSLEKIRVIAQQLEEISRGSPGHPKIAELEVALQAARLEVSKQLIADISSQIPASAQPHLDTLSRSIDGIGKGDDEFIKASKSLVIAVNTENFALMQKKCIPPENYEASKKVLGKISSLHNLLMVKDTSHLVRFLNLLEAAKGCIAK